MRRKRGSVWIGIVAAIGLASAGAVWAQSIPPIDTSRLDPSADAVAPVAPPPPGELAAWDFAPRDALPAPFDAVANPVPKRPPAKADLARLPAARMLLDGVPTDRYTDLLADVATPQGPFTVEMWVNYHVNQPVGALLFADGPDDGLPAWALGFAEGDVMFQRAGARIIRPLLEVKASARGQNLARGLHRRGEKRYWHHLVGVFDGEMLTLYHNGAQVARSSARGRLSPGRLELAGYLAAEPHMRLGDLVRAARLYPRALTDSEVGALFAHRRTPIAYGSFDSADLHFTTTMPLLAWPRPTAMRILWETNAPAQAKVEWGPTKALGQSLELAASDERLRKADITGLKPNAVYHYRITASVNGQSIASPILAFRTAPQAGDPIVIGAISDTEARPHVNDRIADLLWRESPQVVLNVGDLTDGGRAPHRVEWTHEYLAAMAPLMARTPVLPVMGNGEDDFVWFERYHSFESPGRSYYALSYGDLDIFVLDSNLLVRDRTDPSFRPTQRMWFEAGLKASKARWKIVAFHHPLLPEQYPEVAADFGPLIEASGVDLVLVGHHHAYLRSWPLRGDKPNPAGVTYVQLGNAGGNLAVRGETTDPRWAKSYQGFGYVIVRAFGDTLSLDMHDDTGALRDRWERRKPAP